MRIHVFNPDHDLALASGRTAYTPPHAARRMRADLGFLPALYADDGDVVLVDDVEAAVEAVRHVRKYAADVLYLSFGDLARLPLVMDKSLKLDVWGWDKPLAYRLGKCCSGLKPLLPDDSQLADLRSVSNRRFAATVLLSMLVPSDRRLVGHMVYCQDEQEVRRFIMTYSRCVLKAPWSCSGRGVRYVDGSLTPSQEGWCANIIRQQGGLMAEPYYDKVKDFAMEFCIGDDGKVVYRGLSLFRTRAGAYEGSICATEQDKCRMLMRYVEPELLYQVRTGIEKILGQSLPRFYRGCFGVDMMVVRGFRGEGFLLHPCVELNLRRTMGHLSLALSPEPGEQQRLMTIEYNGRYHLRISRTSDNVLCTDVL